MQRTVHIKRNLTAALLASLSVVMLSGASHAAERISLRDADLTTPPGAALFNARVERAARHICAAQGLMTLGAQGACRRDVHDEAEAQLSNAQRRAFAAAATPAPIRVASVATR